MLLLSPLVACGVPKRGGQTKYPRKTSEFGGSTAGCHGERNISKETQEWEQATHSPLLKPSEKGTMAVKRFKDSYEVVRIKTEKKDFSKSITPQERFLERSEKPQRNLRKVRDVVEINGKKYYVM